MQLKKRQHYVPRFYLKNFSANDNSKVDYYDKVIQKTLNNMHVDNVAQQKYYYDFSDKFVGVKTTKLDKQYLENYFSTLENSFAITLKDLINKISGTSNILNLKFEALLSTKGKVELSSFLALQSIRTPSYRSLATNFFEILKEELPNDFSNLNSEDYYNEMFFFNLEYGVLERLSNHFSNNFDWSLGVIIDPEQAKHPAVRKMHVTDEFLISDHPIINLKHVKKRDPSNTSLEFAIPITPNYIVILRDKNHPDLEDSSVFRINRNQIRIYNEYQCRFSERQVFYSKKTNRKKIETFFKLPRSITNNSGTFCVLEF